MPWLSRLAQLEDLVPLAPHLDAHAFDFLPDVVHPGHVRLSNGTECVRTKGAQQLKPDLQELEFLGELWAYEAGEDLQTAGLPTELVPNLPGHMPAEVGSIGEAGLYERGAACL